MSESRSAQQRARHSGDQQLQAKMDAVRRLREQGYAPGAFVIGRGPAGAADMRTAAASVHAPIALPKARSTPKPEPRPMAAAKPIDEGTWGSIKAGMRGGVDSLPFDLGDIIPAGVHALGDAVSGQGLSDSYHARLAAEQAQNRYDEAVHPTARTIGKVTGTAAQMAVPGVGWARMANGRRMVEAAPLIFKEGARLTGLGAGGGVAMQVGADVVQGRPSSVGDYAGSALGGAATVMTALGGRPGYAGGVGGAVTSLGQDVFNGRIRSGRDAGAAIDRAASAAAVGNLLASPVGMAVARATKRLPNLKRKSRLTKGDVGEILALQRSRLRGLKIADVQKAVKVGRRKSITDHRTTDDGIVEGKFGLGPRLSEPQILLRAAHPNYRVDHFLPKDVGSMVEIPVGIGAAQWSTGGERD